MSTASEDEKIKAEKFREETVKRLEIVKIKLRAQKELIKQLRSSSTRLILGIIMVTFAYSVYDLYNKAVLMKRDNGTHSLTYSLTRSLTHSLRGM